MDLPVNIQNAPLDHGSAGQHSKCSFLFSPGKAKFSSSSLSSILWRSPDKRLQQWRANHWRVPPLAWRGLAKTQIQPWSQQPTHLSAEHRRSKDRPGRRHAAEGRHSKPGASSAASASSSPGRQSQQPPHPHLLHTLPENLGKRREIGFLCLVRTGSPKDENKQTSVKIKDERSLENRPEETAGL